MRVYILLIIGMLTVSCYQPERVCSDFRTGTFEFSYIIEGKETTDMFIRNDSIEIAYTNSTTDTSSIRWVNDCEFIVKKLYPTSLSEQKAVHIKIIATTKDSYTFEYAIVGDTKNKQRGVAKKID
ncbi:hypothetical protein [Leptobacterium sp. I13]|uniref:hypothetical protein n=1 Tax=Leptobacterium meishanense TaxID=3128904 RepID=UPI0030EEBEFE